MNIISLELFTQSLRNENWQRNKKQIQPESRVAKQRHTTRANSIPRHCWVALGAAGGRAGWRHHPLLLSITPTAISVRSPQGALQYPQTTWIALTAPVTPRQCEKPGAPTVLRVPTSPWHPEAMEPYMAPHEEDDEALWDSSSPKAPGQDPHVQQNAVTALASPHQWQLLHRDTAALLKIHTHMHPYVKKEQFFIWQWAVLSVLSIMHQFGCAWAAEETWWGQWVLSEDLPHSQQLNFWPCICWRKSRVLFTSGKSQFCSILTWYYMLGKGLH